MADKTNPVTTQRAYTLRLRGVDPQNQSWRDALWATHEAVNKGAKVFGDWLLTLRGGLDHTLADAKIKGVKNKPDRDPTPEERRNRRILLALSWLSVESAPKEGDAHGQFVVADGTESKASRDEKVLKCFRGLLEKRGVSEKDIECWVKDCEPSLSADIREDAVWVNRSAMFDQLTDTWDKAQARSDAHTLLSCILSANKNDFLDIPAPRKSKDKEDDSDNEGLQTEERQKALKATSKGAGQRTRHPFSHLFGEGKPFGKPTRSLDLRSHWHDDLKQKIEKATEIPVAAVRQKGKKKDKSAGPAHTELQREMLSKAASRVAQIVTKQRQQEADRLARKNADEKLAQMEKDPSYRDALECLALYCEEYRALSGATGDFRIRPAQIAGWANIVKRWVSIVEDNEDAALEARILAVKEAQDAGEDKKFGDANLFFRLAEERFHAVWHRNGKTEADILEAFVKGMKARSDSERLKVAAYRHPDPHRNPIFCQFGVSRPSIHFRRLKAFTDDPAGNDPRAIGMLLWHPSLNSARLTIMHAVSRRIEREIGTACDAVHFNSEDMPEVSRRGRLGAAAAGLSSVNSPARVAGVFDLKRVKSRTAAEDDDDANETGDQENAEGTLKEPKWNGTLSTDRRALMRIGRLRDRATTENGEAKRETLQKANRHQEQLRWTLTVSMEMEGRGPWYRYVKSVQDRTPFERTVRKDKPKDKNDLSKGLVECKGDKRIETEGWPWQEFNKPLKDNNDKSALVEDAKAARGNKACLILSRLPGLRVLSVDLGHRFAAACAVWEALSTDTMKQEVGTRKIRAGGMGKDDLYCHVETLTDKVAKNGRNKGKPVTRITIYRRIGAETLPDGKPHPAPWARLDRQFMIKLPGEDKSARAASTSSDANEMAMVQNLAKELGLVAEDDQNKGRAVDQLMSRAVRLLKVSLNRHARRAKIAYALDPATKSSPGMGGSEKAFTPGDEDHIKFLTNALFDWHALASESKWNDKIARDLWNEHVASLDDQWRIHDPATDASTDEELTRQQRRKKDDERKEQLKFIAEKLAKADRTAMHQAWKERWEQDDGTPADHEAGRKATGFHAHLRLITDWIMGRRLPGADGNGWRQNVGGLSLTRIATMRSLYQLHKAFAMRAKPDKPRGAPEKGETNAGVAQSILNAMEKMREQRVKQLASRITEAALGIGRIKSEHLEAGAARPRAQVDKPCHAVVIENLANYRPDELQTRQENRQLMAWSSSKVKKYLSESCQLHGLHLREVQAGYTSRQDSRTGAPGMRCKDVPVEEFKTAPWWRRQVNRANEKMQQNKGDARDRYLHELDKNLTTAPSQNGSKSVRIPVNGGDLFVSADPRSPSVKGIQADLNAAANVGLRALLDPDWSGKWWYVPCASATHQPHPDKVKGSDVFKASEPLAPLPDSSSSQNGSKPAKKQREIVNFWRDPSPEGPQTGQKWRGTAAYWNDVRCRVIQVLSEARSDTNVPVESPATPW